MLNFGKSSSGLGLSLPDEKYSANQSYITITQPNGSLIRSPLNSMSGGNEVGKFSPTPSQTSPSSLPPSEEHMDSNGGPKAIYLQNMSMDRVAFSKLKGQLTSKITDKISNFSISSK